MAGIIALSMSCSTDDNNNNKKYKPCVDDYLYYQSLKTSEPERYVSEVKKEEYDTWTGKEKCCWKTAERAMHKHYTQDPEPIKTCNENNPGSFEDKFSIEANKTYVRMLNLFK